CLAIDQILVRGVVRSETGMIAVVVNSINKAYFLKETDPVFNGYVLRITGDSVVFKETYQDRLGKELTREVAEKITTPAVYAARVRPKNRENGIERHVASHDGPRVWGQRHCD